MPRLREILDIMSRPLDPSVDWIELVRDLESPIFIQAPRMDLSIRWAERKDLLAIDAMQFFVKEVELMEREFELGDRFLLIEQFGKICAFAWVTFRDCRLGLWHMLSLQAGSAYLVYIHVQPEYRNKGVGTYLMSLLMHWLSANGYCRLISGTFGHWEIPIRLHIKSGFKICKKYTERRILRFFPFPPKVTQVEE